MNVFRTKHSVSGKAPPKPWKPALPHDVATPSRTRPNCTDPERLLDVIHGLAARPVERLIRRWNWKSALLSSIVRSAIFFGVNAVAGMHEALGAMATEFGVRALTAGFYGSLTQSFRRVQPAWQATLAVMILLPIANHSVEFLAHWLRGTAKLYLSVGVSIAFTALSTAFHLFVMRRGLLIVGEGSQSLGEDFQRMPRAVFAFVSLPFAGLWRALRPRQGNPSQPAGGNGGVGLHGTQWSAGSTG